MENPGPNPGSEPESESPTPMVRQAHGGMLKRGGRHAKAGRPANKIKAKCRREFEALMPILKQVAKGELKPSGRAKLLDPAGEYEEVSVRDRLEAIKIFGKFGMDTNVAISDVRAALLNTRQELMDVLPKDQFEMLWARIMSHWVKL